MLELGGIQDIIIYLNGSPLEEFTILNDGFFKELGKSVVFQASTPWVQGQDVNARFIILTLTEKKIIPSSYDPDVFLGVDGELGINFPLPSPLTE